MPKLQDTDNTIEEHKAVATLCLITKDELNYEKNIHVHIIDISLSV